ncbi:MAG TPA: Rieske 2Fe-2S domain-containing protein [Alphaproteobacteria bacterium]
MLSKEHSDLITLTGPATKGGELLRRYWQPVALSAELEADVPLPVKIMGEDLALFRDDHGTPALIGRHCPHRGVDLSYGRVEDGGLRCLYHGWLISSGGRCLEQPGEPAGSTFKDKVRHVAYPCFEAGGLVMTYMGPGQPPRRPALPCFNASPERVWTTKIHHDCNYLQGNEGNIDPQHLSYLHRFIDPRADPVGINALLVADPSPKIEVEETAYGLRIFTTRAVGGGKSYIRITNFIMPNLSAFEGAPLVNPQGPRMKDNIGYQMHWHMPIDDVTHWKYTLLYAHAEPIDKAFIEKFVFCDVTEDYTLPGNRRNRYLQDREEMKRTSFAGMGPSFWAHDKFATESQRPIADRSREHLGTTDRPTIMMRRQLLQAIEDVAAGRDPLLVERDGQPDALAEMEVVSKEMPSTTDPRGDWWRQHAPRRKRAAQLVGE